MSAFSLVTLLGAPILGQLLAWFVVRPLVNRYLDRRERPRLPRAVARRP